MRTHLSAHTPHMSELRREADERQGGGEERQEEVGGSWSKLRRWMLKRETEETRARTRAARRQETLLREGCRRTRTPGWVGELQQCIKRTTFEHQNPMFNVRYATCIDCIPRARVKSIIGACQYPGKISRVPCERSGKPALEQTWPYSSKTSTGKKLGLHVHLIRKPRLVFKILCCNVVSLFEGFLT